LTPYYNEPVLFSIKELEEENEDGVSTLFYLQKIYPGQGTTLPFTPFHVVMCNDEVSSEHLAFTLSCHAYVCRRMEKLSGKGWLGGRT
jgi:hypothetical protein